MNLKKGLFYKGICSGATNNYSKNRDKELSFIPIDEKNVIWFADNDFRNMGGTYPVEWFEDIEQVKRCGFYEPNQFDADEETMQLTLL